MTRGPCEACGTSPAVVSLTQVTTDSVTTRRLCAACATALGVETTVDPSIPTARPLASFLETHSAQERERMLERMRGRYPRLAEHVARAWGADGRKPST